MSLKVCSQVPFLLLCLTTAQMAAQTPRIVQPSANAIIGDTLVVRVSVSSIYELNFVRATIGPLTTNLLPAGSLWTNVLNTSSFAAGSYTLTVLAEDVFGNAGEVQQMIWIDRPPLINVASPLNGTVGHTSLHVKIGTVDDYAGDVRISVYAVWSGGGFLFAGTNSIERTVGGFEGTLRVEAVDASGQTAVAQRTVYLERSTNLVEAFTAPGPLLDFFGSRLLYSSILDPAGPKIANVLDVSSGITIDGPALWSSYPVPGQYYTPVQGWISASTALAVYQAPFVASEYVVGFYETNAATLEYAYPYSGGVAEDLDDGVTMISNVLYDLRQSTNGCVPYVGDYPIPSTFYRDISRQAIVFVASNGVFRSQPSDAANACSTRAVTQLSSKAQPFNPIRDGTTVVFQWGTNIVANFNGTDEILSSWPTSGVLQYLANGGWIAFTRPGTTNQQQLWTRSPAGELQRRTFFSVSSYLESLNTDGTITFHVSQNGGPPVGRYLSVSGAQPIWINSGQGRMKWQAGTPFLILGRSAFRIALGNLRIELAGPASTTLRLSSPGNIRHAIQESSNLTSWSTVANLTGSATLTNHINGTAPKFFRALMGD